MGLRRPSDKLRTLVVYPEVNSASHPIKITLPADATVRQAARTCAAYFNLNPLRLWTLLKITGAEGMPEAKIGDVFRPNERAFVHRSHVHNSDDFHWPWD